MRLPDISAPSLAAPSVSASLEEGRVAVCQLRIFNRFETTMKYKCESEGDQTGRRRITGEGEVQK